jgi:hypothetical protein
MVRRGQRPGRARRAGSLLAKTHIGLPHKNNRPGQRNPHRRQQNFHLSRRRPPLLPTSPSRRNLHRLQPSLHAPRLPSLLPPRAKRLHLPLPRRHILSQQRRSPRRPPAQTSTATDPRTPRQRHRRQRLSANVRGTHPSRKSGRLLATGGKDYLSGGVLYFTAFASTPSVTVTIASAGISFNSCTYPLGQRIKIESTLSCFPSPK